ncbi:MAG: amidohydrolase family protein [Pseudacidovorax sp.]|nr:amidohydrolase family protein [Pseudacidovorax sp.]
MTRALRSLRNVRLGDAPADAARVDIGIEGGVIRAIGPAGSIAGPPGPADLDGSGLIAFPGFVNAHAHSNEMFEQGSCDGEPLEVWLALAYPPLGADAIPVRWHYLRAMMLALRSLRSGVTALHDDFLNPGGDEEALQAVLDAYDHAGLRARVAVTLSDRGYLDGLPFARAEFAPGLSARLDARPPRALDAQFDVFHRARHALAARGCSRLGLSLGPRGPQRCTPALLRRVADTAAAHAVPVHMHVLESRTQAVTAQQQYGRSFIEVLDEAGLLGPQLAMNHAVWLTDADIERVAERGARVVHNPLSNFKLASGRCPVGRLLAAGVEVAIGTDGAATGDSVDYLDSLRMASLIHKLDASAAHPAPDAARLVRMATADGAATMGNAAIAGEIAVGRVADITLLDACDLAFVPLHDPRRQLCFAATSSAVHTVVVDGRVVFADGHATGVDEPALRDEIAEAAERFRHEVFARRAGGGPVVDAVRRVLARAAAEGSPFPFSR